MGARLAAASLVLVFALAGCAPASPPGATAPSGAQPAPGSVSTRTLVISIRVEPGTIASQALQQAGVTLGTVKRAFNADLVQLDHTGVHRAYLAEAVPRLNTSDWQVFADGRMETTYRLRPNVVWHDGVPLTAEDLAFAFKVLSTPDLGQAQSPPINIMEAVQAVDDRTVLIKWRRPYPDAGVLGSARGAEFAPLPRHVLQRAFDEGQWDAFAAHPFWSRDFVGLGPYRIDRWEPGAFIEAVAFDRHILGRPKIDRLRFVFISDANSTLANLLASEVHFAADDSIRFEQSRVLRDQWSANQGGTIIAKPSLWRAAYFQLRPDLASPPAVLDLRVRKAMAHAVDRATLNQGMYDGEAILADTVIAPSVDYYGEVDRAITKYPYDLRRSQQLMAEASYARGGDGAYTSPTAGKLTVEAKTNAATQQEQELAILGDTWRRAGFDVREAILPAAQAQDSQVRASFPGIFAFSSPQGESALVRYNTAGIPRPDNRWTGNNRGGWSNQEFDRLSESFNASLDRPERARLAAQMAKIFTEELPAISLYFNAIPIAFLSGLKGPQPSVPDAEWAWNLQEWEFR